jgi:hypothetical protein
VIGIGSPSQFRLVITTTIPQNDLKKKKQVMSYPIKAARYSQARSRMTNRAARGWILSGIGFLFLLVAICIAAYSWNFLRHAQPSQGLVIGLAEKQDRGDHSAARAPIFAFQDGSGITHTNNKSASYSSPPDYQIGEKVPVLYNRLNPDQAKINSFMEIWGISAIQGGLGLVLMAVGTGMLLWPRFVNRFRNAPVSSATV